MKHMTKVKKEIQFSNEIIEEVAAEEFDSRKCRQHKSFGDRYELLLNHATNCKLEI